MATTTPSPSPSRARGLRLHARLGAAALFVGLWLCLMSGPSAVDIGLDPSWKLILQKAAHENWQFGTDIVFTFGPLGYLLNAANLGVNLKAMLVWELLANLGVAAVIFGYGRRLPGARQVYYYVFFIVLGAGVRDTLHLMIITMLALALLREPVLQRRWLVVLINAFIGVLALVKFPNMMLGGFAVFAVISWLAWLRRWREFAWVALSASLTVIGGWMATGQALGHLPAYVFNSLNLSGGYVATMGVDATPTMWWLGIVACLAVAAYYVFAWVSASDRPRMLTAVLIAAACSFISWKHGFVRADGHVMAHFMICLLLVVTYPVLLAVNASWRRAKIATLTVLAGVSLGAVYVQSPDALYSAGTIFNTRIYQSVSALSDLPQYRKTISEELERRKNTFRLDALRERAAGGKSIDMLGHEQAYLILNDLNYVPRPSLQSYAAMTDHVMRLNAEHLASEKAPDLLLYRVGTIDYRLPTLDDSLAVREMFRHYNFVSRQDNFLLFERRPERDPNLDVSDLVSEITVGWGDTITPPVESNHPIWCEIEIRPSLFGRARNFLYKLPLVKIDTLTDNGRQADYRLPITMAPAGFPTYPHLTSNEHVVRYQQGGDVPRIAEFQLKVSDDEVTWFDDEITVRFHRLRPYPVAYPEGNDVPGGGFRNFSHVPDAIDAVYYPNIIEENNRNRLFSHPPCRLRFDLGDEVTTVRGFYGFFAGAYSGEGKTDGVQFVIEWTDPSGHTTELLNRLLDPINMPADRNEQSFNLTLPPGQGQLSLITREGPRSDITYDWVYWSDVTIE